MATDGLTDDFSSIDLQQSDYVLFKPPDDFELELIPRYLFRVFDKRSDGATSRSWASSKDAWNRRKDASTDIFSRKSYRQVAAMLNRHLGWCGQEQDPDNFVSWTSSMLFALRYMLFRHTRYKLNLDEIYLCIIDTTAFPEGVFARDMDLLDAFLEYDSNLKNFKILRSKRHREYTGSYYFGEYLSQGALRIQGNCDIVSAQVIIDQGLFILRPELAEYGSKASTLANEVIRLREKFVRSKQLGHVPEASFIEVNAAMEIAQLFEPRWMMPIAASLLALRPRRRVDDAIVRAFRAPIFSSKSCSVA